MRTTTRIRRGFVLFLLFALPATALAELTAELRRQLEESTYVYISSTRKDGELGSPAEIWFLWHEESVWVGTPADTWRVKRIEAGRPEAKIWVGSPDGPALRARGEVSDRSEVREVLYETFARKYPEGWMRFEQRFRSGLEDGSRLLVRYVLE